MGSILGKIFSIVIVVGLGFGIHSLLSYIPIYKTHAQDVAFAVYFLNIGASLLVFFFGMPEIATEETENAD
jgi:Ca2+/Na+ antiporter